MSAAFHEISVSMSCVGNVTDKKVYCVPLAKMLVCHCTTFTQCLQHGNVWQFQCSQR